MILIKSQLSTGVKGKNFISRNVILWVMAPYNLVGAYQSFGKPSPSILTCTEQAVKLDELPEFWVFWNMAPCNFVRGYQHVVITLASIFILYPDSGARKVFRKYRQVYE
jgi:hypothetical protein